LFLVFTVVLKFSTFNYLYALAADFFVKHKNGWSAPHTRPTSLYLFSDSIGVLPSDLSASGGF